MRREHAGSEPIGAANYEVQGSEGRRLTSVSDSSLPILRSPDGASLDVWASVNVRLPPAKRLSAGALVPT